MGSRELEEAYRFLYDALVALRQVEAGLRGTEQAGAVAAAAVEVAKAAEMIGAMAQEAL